jgi:uncharacterized protein YbjT (DUF2867 family)
MIKSRIIVTGATGKTGSVVVAELLKPAILAAARLFYLEAFTPEKAGKKFVV